MTNDWKPNVELIKRTMRQRYGLAARERDVCSCGACRVSACRVCSVSHLSRELAGGLCHACHEAENEAVSGPLEYDGGRQYPPSEHEPIGTVLH